MPLLPRASRPLRFTGYSARTQLLLHAMGPTPNDAALIVQESLVPSHARRRPRRTAPPSDLDRALDRALALPAPPPRTFGQLGLPQALVTVLARRGIHEPFAIQARALPDGLAGRDVLGRAQTGAGKTLAFGLPVVARLSGDRSPRQPLTTRALVLVPTRELARQVADELAPLGHALDLRVTAVYGGAPMGRQIDTLRRGVDVVVATPGRLIDLMERRAVALDRVAVTVLDEADHMADLGFLPAVTQILDATPAGGQRLLFSATLDRGVDRLVRRYLTDPAVHAVAAATTSVESMDHHVFVLPSDAKVAIASEVAMRPGRTLFFVRTKHGADRLAKQLCRAGAQAAAIHGNLNQSQRQRALAAFAAGSTRVLVATDVAARGIHVDDVDLVVHFDPPNDHKDYLHRSGRTARAGAGGTVLSFVDHSQKRDLARMHEAAAVTPETTAVHVGHPAVRAMAESGEVIQVARLRDFPRERTEHRPRRVDSNRRVRGRAGGAPHSAPAAERRAARGQRLRPSG